MFFLTWLNVSSGEGVQQTHMVDLFKVLMCPETSHAFPSSCLLGTSRCVVLDIGTSPTSFQMVWWWLTKNVKFWRSAELQALGNIFVWETAGRPYLNLPAVGTPKAYCCYIVMSCRRERILKRCAFSMRTKAPQPTGRSVTAEVAMRLRWLPEGQAATFQVHTFVIFWWMLRVSVCVFPSLIGKIAITRSKSPAGGQFAIPLDLASSHLASKAFKPTGIFWGEEEVQQA